MTRGNNFRIIKLQHVKASKQIEAVFQKEIGLYFKNNIYQPLAKSLVMMTKEGFANSQDSILNAINSGQITWSNKVVKGRFTPTILKEFRELGYKFDKRIDGFRVPDLKHLPIDMQVSFGKALNDQESIGNVFLEAVDNVNISRLLGDEVFRKKVVGIYESIYTTTTTKVNDTIRSALPAINLTKKIGASKEFAENFTNSLELPIQGFLEDEVAELRVFIQNQISVGFSPKNTEEYIMERFGVSQRKARFLSLQETKLATNEAKGIQYREAGINEYLWDDSGLPTVRPDHKILDGKKFYYDSPPIVDRRTGRRANPGGDFGCQCVDIPFVELPL